MGIFEEKEMKNEINCVYYKKEETISLLYDYSKSFLFNGEIKKVHDEAKNNLKYIDIYINEKKTEFKTKYTSNERGEIRVKFIFHKLLTNTAFMFSRCSSLESIDLSSFNTTNVTNMRGMFYDCSSLKSINLSSFNTINVTNISGMFYYCSSLKSIDLSSFNTTNVTNMIDMLYGCSSLKKENIKVSENGKKILAYSSCNIF